MTVGRLGCVWAMFLRAHSAAIPSDFVHWQCHKDTQISLRSKRCSIPTGLQPSHLSNAILVSSSSRRRLGMAPAKNIRTCRAILRWHLNWKFTRVGNKNLVPPRMVIFSLGTCWIWNWRCMSEAVPKDTNVVLHHLPLLENSAFVPRFSTGWFLTRY